MLISSSSKKKITVCIYNICILLLIKINICCLVKIYFSCIDYIHGCVRVYVCVRWDIKRIYCRWSWSKLESHWLWKGSFLSHDSVPLFLSMVGYISFLLFNSNPMKGVDEAGTSVIKVFFSSLHPVLLDFCGNHRARPSHSLVSSRSPLAPPTPLPLLRGSPSPPPAPLPQCSRPLPAHLWRHCAP